MEKEINVLDEKSEYDYDKLLKKLKLVRNGFITTGKYGMPIIKNKILIWIKLIYGTSRKLN